MAIIFNFIQKMKFVKLILCLIVINSVFSQSNNKFILPITSVYFAPFALPQYSVGNMIRGGIEQRFFNNMSLIVEGTYYFSEKRYYSNLRGFRFENGLRYYIFKKQAWFGFTYGLIRQNFQIEGRLIEASKTQENFSIFQCERIVNFLHFSIGTRYQISKQFYFEYGIQIGLRQRDVDIKNIDNTLENNFRVKIGDDNISAAMNTKMLLIPDFAILARIGICTRK